MSRVERLAEFPRDCFIRQFSGKTYEKAVDEANKIGGFSFYYEQKHFYKNRTILVCY